MFAADGTDILKHLNKGPKFTDLVVIRKDLVKI